MPTTTERSLSGRSLPLAGLLAALSIWFACMAVAATMIRPDAIIAFGLPAQMIPAIARSEGDLLDAGRFYVSARTGPSTVRSLYAAGAWFVWPALTRQCGRW